MKRTSIHKTISRKLTSFMTSAFLFLSVNAFTQTGYAESNKKDFCIPVRAKIESTFVTDGCESPVGLCTEGRVTRGGFLNGKTSFVALGAAPSAGLEGVEPETTLSYSGELKVSTRHGSWKTSDVGVFDQAAGTFSELDRVVEGTGKFKNASGQLFIYGNATADGSGFTGDIRGEICLSR